MSREWVPECYVDEVSPPPRASASDWVMKLPGDAYALAPFDVGEDEPHRVLHDGDVVRFHWTEHFGTATLLIGEGGSWSVDCEPPEPVTHVCAIGDAETLAYGAGRGALEEFVRQWIENDAEPAAIAVAYYTWSETPTSFEFRGGAFRQIAGA